MSQMYVWIGAANQVFKVEHKKAVERGVPFEAPALFEDLYANDPMYVAIDQAEGVEVLHLLKEAKDRKTRMKIIQDVIRTLTAENGPASNEMSAWKMRRDAHRQVTTVVPGEPEKKADETKKSSVKKVKKKDGDA